MPREAEYALQDRPTPATPDRVHLDRLGPSYRVTVDPLGATYTFRDVRTDRDLTADLAVSLGTHHLFRSSATLSLVGRDKVARTAAELGTGDSGAWRRATFAAVEAVMAAEEHLGSPVDLRTVPLVAPAGGLHVLRPLWPTGSTILVAPGESGKSTIARALAVSLGNAATVIRGIDPVGEPRPVLYVAAEDPVAYWHGRSVDAICRGLGIDRRRLPQPIELFDARGRPLHRIARSIAERAADFGAVILDSQQALLAQVDGSGSIRDRDSLFWHPVDQSDVPTFIVAHPNRSDAREWSKADGRIAGSEVNRDRARMAWRVAWEDGPAVVGTSFRRYSLENTKHNHGPREADLAFAAAWQFGLGSDPGSLRFVASEPMVRSGATLSAALADTLREYEAGNTTPAVLATALGIGLNTAKSRLRLLRERGLVKGSSDVA